MATFYGCFGIVKGRMPSKGVWEFKASTYESAIKQLKTHAQNNYRDDYKESTLFGDGGRVLGWCFRSGGVIVYASKSVLQNIGLMPKRKV